MEWTQVNTYKIIRYNLQITDFDENLNILGRDDKFKAQFFANFGHICTKI